MKKTSMPAIIILLILATLAGVAVQMLVAMRLTVFNHNFYFTQMEKNHLYDIPQNYILLSVKNSMNESLSEPVCKALTPAISQSFSHEWTEMQASNLIDGFIGYLTGSMDKLELKVELQSRKNILQSMISAELAKNYSIKALHSFGIVSADEIAQQIIVNIDLPDYIDFAVHPLFTNTEMQSFMNTIRYYYGYTTFWPYLLYLVLLFLFIVIKGRRSGLRWFGISVLLSSILVILMASASQSVLDEFIINNVSGYDNLFSDFGMNPVLLVTLLKNAIVGKLNSVSVIFSIIGTAMIFAAFCMKKQDAKRVDDDVEL